MSVFSRVWALLLRSCSEVRQPSDPYRFLLPKQPVVKVWLHSTVEASPPAALLLAQILPVFSVVAPCRRGASTVSVRRQTFTTGCEPVTATAL